MVSCCAPGSTLDEDPWGGDEDAQAWGGDGDEDAQAWGRDAQAWDEDEDARAS